MTGATNQTGTRKSGFEVRTPRMVRFLAMAAFLLPVWAVAGAATGGGAAAAAAPLQVAEAHAKPKEKAKEHEKKPEGEEKPEPKKPPKPKPKKPNKEKNCQWDEDIDVEIDNKHLKISQPSLKNVMRGGETQQNGYNIYADTDKLVLKIRAPDANWYVANMTRLGDLDEGCVFYMVGEMRQVEGEPPLY